MVDDIHAFSGRLEAIPSDSLRNEANDAYIIIM